MNYIEKKNTIIFNYKFNKVIDKELLSEYKKIIFNDFDGYKFVGSNFNQKIDLSPNLTHITFGLNFNQKVDLPQNLTHLTFGVHFNQKVDLPQNLTHLTFGLPRKL